MSGSGISWAICTSAPRSRQITMPAPHHSVFYRPDALPATQPTASKHWRQFFWRKMHKKVFGNWAPPRPAGGAYSAPPDTIAGFKGGALWQVNTGKGGQGMDKGDGERRDHPPTINSWIRHWLQLKQCDTVPNIRTVPYNIYMLTALRTTILGQLSLASLRGR